MKPFLLFPVSAFLIFTGCSHTYIVSEYYSKEELCKEFNNSAQNRELNITLINDSSFIVTNGAKIRDDILHFNNSELPASEVKQVSYNNHLKGIVPGFLIGTVSGGIIGVTGLLGKPKTGGNHPQWNQFESAVGGVVLGFVIGSIIGAVKGFNYYFIFNP